MPNPFPPAGVAVACLSFAPLAAAQEALTLDAGALYVLVPTTWVRRDLGDRMRFAPPEASQADRVVLAVDRALSLRGRFLDWFPRAWSDFSRGYTDAQLTVPVREMRSSAGHSWAIVHATMRDPLGRPLWVTFYAAARNRIAQVIVYAGADSTLYTRWASWMQDALENYAQFTESPAPARAPAGGTVAPLTAADLFPSAESVAESPAATPRVYGTPGGSPMGDTVPDPLDGIYSGLVPGAGHDLNVGRDFVTFYPDGRVFRRLPEGGLEGFDRDAAERDAPALWGRYEPVGPGTWQIRWNGWDHVSPVAREGDGLRYDGNFVSLLPGCAGQMLDGRFEMESPATTFPWAIAFTPDGGFRDDSLVGAVSYQREAAATPRQIAGGAGRYRVGRNTLHLDYDDGRRVLVAFYAPCGAADGAAPGQIWINGAGLVQRRAGRPDGDSASAGRGDGPGELVWSRRAAPLVVRFLALGTRH